MILFLISRGKATEGVLPLLPVNEAALTLIFVFQDEAVNRSDGAAKFDGGTFFITIRFDQFLNDQIFILFVHCKFNLSHTGTS